MITSDKQYEAADKKLQMLQQSLKAPTQKGIPDEIANAFRSQTQEMIDELNKNMDEYIKLKENVATTLEINSLEDLLVAPIRYRLTNHMSIEKFGQEVGVSPRQIARYEKEEYRNINTSTLNKILGNLDINIHGRINPKQINKDKVG